MRVLWIVLLGILYFLSVGGIALCQAVTATATQMPVTVVVAPGPMQAADFLSMVFQSLGALGGMSFMMKLSTVIMLLIASMKVSVLNQYTWSKLGGLQVWVAPALGLIAGVLGIGAAGPITAASVLAYVIAGSGAVFLHEILDSIKELPGVGPFYRWCIDLAESCLGGGSKDDKQPS